MKLIYKIFCSIPVEKCFICWREKQSAISETYGYKTRMRVTHRFRWRKTKKYNVRNYLFFTFIECVSCPSGSVKLLSELKTWFDDLLYQTPIMPLTSDIAWEVAISEQSLLTSLHIRTVLQMCIPKIQDIF